MLSRRRGFTLIELLVVIAIIGILAAMLFPVFARARESARKIQCLSNIKNIAMAYQMYLTDYDRFPPSGKGFAPMMQWLDDNCDGCRTACAPTDVNPYLRIPVILDEYIKNRDVWRCPSAKFSLAVSGVEINPGIPDWWTYYSTNCFDGPCPRPKMCNQTFPPGWGGRITDSGAQGACGDEGAFDQSVGTSSLLRDVNLGQLRDVSRTLVCGDSGTVMEGSRTSQFAYPDQKRINFVALGCGAAESGHCDEDSCGGGYSLAVTCSQLSVCFGGDGRFSTDVAYRKTFSRHMGGSNLGFADGHAKWMDAEQILFGGYDAGRFGMHPQLFYGSDSCFNPTAGSRWDHDVPNDPTAGEL